MLLKILISYFALTFFTKHTETATKAIKATIEYTGTRLPVLANLLTVVDELLLLLCVEPVVFVWTSGKILLKVPFAFCEITDPVLISTAVYPPSVPCLI